VHLAESLGVWISFEPIHESKGINEKVWDDLGIRDRPGYERAVSRLIDLKKNGAPIINSQTYLSMIKSLNPRFKCHASDIILHVASDGTIENCRVHKYPLGKVSDGLEDVWASSAKSESRSFWDARAVYSSVMSRTACFTSLCPRSWLITNGCSPFCFHDLIDLLVYL